MDTQTILTIASHVITKNHRIAVSHSDHRTWFLHIREVKESDRGWYMCQINTDPMKSQTGYLEVVGKLNSLCSNRISFLVSLYNFPPGKRVTRRHEMKKSILFLTINSFRFRLLFTRSENSIERKGRRRISRSPFMLFLTIHFFITRKLFESTIIEGKWSNARANNRRN